ncbi:unnamed protein product [Effrenium voratum]|nr:unnamed protein product [Effrenium voratum]
MQHRMDTRLPGARRRRALNRELQAQLDRALREEKAGREAQQADEAHAEWAKRRRSLEELLQARKQKTLGLPPDQFAPAKRPKTEARVAAPQGWRLPEHCQPNPDRSSGASADPQTLWRLAGQQGLACNGWRRLESRRLPGRFYFLHETGRKEMEEGTLTEALEEPKGWQRRASRSRPGFFYFVNLATGEKRPDVSLPKERPVSDQGARAVRSPPKERDGERQAWPWDAVPSLAEAGALPN